MFESLAKNTLVPLLLRFCLAVIFIVHGLEKVNPDMGWGARWGDQMPDPPPAVLQLAVAWGELIGGLAMALGLLTRVAALGITIIMIGAIITATGHRGFSQGYEYNFAIIVMCAALIIVGPGSFSVDNIFFRRKPAS